MINPVAKAIAINIITDLFFMDLVKILSSPGRFFKSKWNLIFSEPKGKQNNRDYFHPFHV